MIAVALSVKPFTENSLEPVVISRVSLWEMAIKVSTGKLDIDLPRFIEKAAAKGFTWLDIKNEHLLTVAAKMARYGETVRGV